jgi:hypothetical protein
MIAPDAFPLVLFENCHDCILLGRGAVAKARRLYANTGGA